MWRKKFYPSYLSGRQGEKRSSRFQTARLEAAVLLGSGRFKGCFARSQFC